MEECLAAKKPPLLLSIEASVRRRVNAAAPEEPIFRETFF